MHLLYPVIWGQYIVLQKMVFKFWVDFNVCSKVPLNGFATLQNGICQLIACQAMAVGLC